MVEHNLAKVGVASSSLVSRSNLKAANSRLFYLVWLRSKVVMQRPAKPYTAVRFRSGPPRRAFVQRQGFDIRRRAAIRRAGS